MKQFLAYMIVTLTALWTAGCSDELGDQPADQPDRGIVIRLSAGQLETRTDLTSQANLQHVREVYALLYDDTGDLVGSPELLMDVDDPSQAWDPTDPTEGGSYNDINGEEFVLPQTKTDGLTAGSYTILCVGLDDNSGATYGLTAETMKWSTLAEAKATLAAGKTADDIAHSELFAGWSGFEFKPDSINVVEVMLKRRVAGVLCYLKDIPSTLTKSDGTGTYKVTKVLLRLFSNQCNSIALPRKEKSAGNTGSQVDFGEGEIADSDVLMSYDLRDCVDSDNDGLYEIPVAEGESRLPNTILMGAYMLPIEYFSEDNKPTFTLEIWGTSDDLPSEECVQSFPVYQNGLLSGPDAERYSIYPNYIYHIGDKPDPDDKTGDYPMSLAGTKITVKPEPWTEMNVNVDFPSVPVKPSFDNSSDFKRQILDCIGQSMTLTIRNAVVHTAWTLTTKTEGVYFKNGNSYSTNFTPSVDELNASVVNVETIITDYAVYNDYTVTPVEEDKRALDIHLMVGSETIDIIDFEQWNALIVGVRGSDDKDDEIDHYVGFNRYDRSSLAWGFNATFDWELFGYGYNTVDKDLKGRINYNNVMSKGYDGWDDSAIYLSHVIGYTVDDKNDRVIENIDDDQWYLGAFYEYYWLFDKAWYLKNIGDNGYNSYFLRERSDKNDVQNVYWTSSVVESTKSYAWAGYIMRNKNHKDGWKDFFDNSLAGYNDSNKREKSYYTRLCKKIQSL